MRKPILIIVIVVLILLALGLAGLLLNNQTEQSTNEETEQPVSSPTSDDNGEDAPAQKGNYSNYTEGSLRDGDTNILFFAASWCPSCNQLDRNLQADREMIPENVNILKVDYDREQALKEKYGVTIQHTLVQVDGDGKLLMDFIGCVSFTCVEKQL